MGVDYQLNRVQRLPGNSAACVKARAQTQTGPEVAEGGDGSQMRAWTTDCDGSRGLGATTRSPKVERPG